MRCQKRFQLQPFRPSGLNVTVRATLCKGLLGLTYSVLGDSSDVWWPDVLARPARRSDNLWQKTCFELFIATRDQSGYLEYNFSPTGDWSAYHFSGYRSAASLPDVLPPKVRRSLNAGRRRQFSVAVDLQRAARLLLTADDVLFATPVILEEGGQCAFWSHRHNPAAPDFHDKSLFEVFSGVATV